MFCVRLAERSTIRPDSTFFGCRDKTVPMIAATKKLISAYRHDLSMYNFAYRHINGGAIFVQKLMENKDVLTKKSRTK